MTKYFVVCGKEVKSKTRITCSQECYYKLSSIRMKKKNPMSDPKKRKKVSKTLKRMNWKPKERGGNGTGETLPQIKLELALLDKQICVIPEYVIPTKMPRGSGYPPCYKIDLAIPNAKIAIEVDGPSHRSILGQERDKKKSEFLNSMGWKVFHFKKVEILNNIENVLSIILK